MHDLPLPPDRDPADRWSQVLLPGRPNGAAGWIRDRGTRATTTPWSIDIDRTARDGTVLRLGRVVRRFPVIIGAHATPTPIGRYFVEETVRLMRGADAGPFAPALSARSSVLRECGRGPGQIALHGRVGLGGIMRSAVSHGRVRLADPDVRRLNARIGPGGPRHHPHRSVRVAAAARDADEHRGAVAIRLRGRPAGW